MQERVAIIGAGPAGLLAAQECLREGFRPVIYEQHNRIGGLWNADAGGHVWRGMQTNISCHSCEIPGYAWPDDTGLFPKQDAVVDYLSRFSERYNLAAQCDLQLNTPVERVSLTDREAYKITTGRGDDSFEKLIVASGFFGTPYVPQELSEFHDVTHSSNISSFESYRGRDVVVVGNGFSGCDIAVALAHHGARVEHVFRRPYYLLPRQFDDTYVDAAFYRYPSSDEGKLTREESYAETHKGLSGFNEAQAEVHPDLMVQDDYSMPPHVSITDGYLEAIEDGLITPRKSQHIPGDIAGRPIIAATGFTTNLSYLAEGIQNRLEYDPTDRFMPVCLHEGVWPRELPGLAFIGMYRGPFFLTLALQARWVARALRDPDYRPNPEDIARGVDVERALRVLTPRPQFPRGDYVGYSLRLAQFADANVDMSSRRGDVFLPAHFARPR